MSSGVRELVNRRKELKAKLTPAVRDLANGTASDKDSSPILRGVLIKEREAIAADGFILIVKQLPSPEMDLDNNQVDDGIKEIVIPADAIRACKGDDVQLSCMEVQRNPLSQLEAITDRFKKVARLDGPDFSVEADAIEGEFPKYPNRFSPSPLVAQIAFNSRVIKKLLKALPDDGIIQLRVSEPDKAVEFQCTDPDGDIPIRGIISPMVCLWDKVTWKTANPVNPEKLIEAVVDTVAQHATEPPKEGEDSITLTAGGKSVTVTGRQFFDAAKGIQAEKKCVVCGSPTHDKGWHNLKQNKGK